MCVCVCVSYPVVAQQGAEVGGLLLVHQLHEAGAVDGVDGREDAAGEETELQELGDGLVLRGFWTEDAQEILLRKTGET